MNNKNWLKSQTFNTTANRCGSFAMEYTKDLVDPRVGIYIALLLFFLNIYTLKM
jgi:hypothetical protein